MGGMKYIVCCVVLAVMMVHKASAGDPPPDMSWEKDYLSWRNRETASVDEWLTNTPKPVERSPADAVFDDMSAGERDAAMKVCLEDQRKAFTAHVLQYRSPDLAELQSKVKALVAEQGLTVTIAVFWGRGRYVELLWQYIERNLAVNMGIVTEVLLIRHDRGDTARATKVLDRATGKYPDVVKEVPFCGRPYGCAYDVYMKKEDRVYIKVDDDIIFIKDGSIEHLVFQMLTNKDYSFFTGAVVNNPHGYAVHGFAGAYQPTSYHWRDTAWWADPPFVHQLSGETAYKHYYGKNVYDSVGSRVHEAFIYNAAHGRLDAYGFDLWNMHQCRCGMGQEGLDMCSHGYYRWSINAFAFTRNVSVLSAKHAAPAFDEPFVGIGWVYQAPPHRVGMVGEALFVHCQYTRQRSSKPDFGLREEILLPWYHLLTNQYMAQPYGRWEGNTTLMREYERIAYMQGEDRFASMPKRPRLPK